MLFVLKSLFLSTTSSRFYGISFADFSLRKRSAVVPSVFDLNRFGSHVPLFCDNDSATLTNEVMKYKIRNTILRCCADWQVAYATVASDCSSSIFLFLFSPRLPLHCAVAEALRFSLHQSPCYLLHFSSYLHVTIWNPSIPSPSLSYNPLV